MKTTLEKHLMASFPEIYPYGYDTPLFVDHHRDYRLLRHFGEYCSDNFDSHQTNEIFHLISRCYTSHNLFVQNAIENEFLGVIAEKLGLSSLLQDMNKIPTALQLIYVRVLFETLKRNSETDHE